MTTTTSGAVSVDNSNTPNTAQTLANTWMPTRSYAKHLKLGNVNSNRRILWYKGETLALCLAPHREVSPPPFLLRAVVVADTEVVGLMEMEELVQVVSTHD